MVLRARVSGVRRAVRSQLLEKRSMIYQLLEESATKATSRLESRERLLTVSTLAEMLCGGMSGPLQHHHHPDVSEATVFNILQLSSCKLSHITGNRRCNQSTILGTDERNLKQKNHAVGWSKSFFLIQII